MSAQLTWGSGCSRSAHSTSPTPSHASTCASGASGQKISTISAMPMPLPVSVAGVCTYSARMWSASPRLRGSGCCEAGKAAAEVASALKPSPQSHTPPQPQKTATKLPAAEPASPGRWRTAPLGG